MDALMLLRRYADRDGRAKVYDQGETVPLDGVVPAAWREAIGDDAGRIVRIPYELCVLLALRDALRRREIWVEVPAGTATPTSTCPATTRTTETCTTPPSDRRRTPASSSPICGANSPPAWNVWTWRWLKARRVECGSVCATVPRGPPCRNCRNLPSHPTWPR